MNLSVQNNEQTASTCFECCLQRAENLSIFGCKSVLELCVGPSLKFLEKAYHKYNIKVVGNDIDKRWQMFYPNGSWLIDDARNINTNGFDAVVVAPPLSRGCSGKREDSLSLEEVQPSYYDFLGLKNKVITYVLPGRTLSIKSDREQLFKFISKLHRNFQIVPLKNKVVKYIDLYVY
jgi:hypothetical protein